MLGIQWFEAQLAFAAQTSSIAIAQNTGSQQAATPTGSAAYPEMMKASHEAGEVARPERLELPTLWFEARSLAP